MKYIAKKGTTGCFKRYFQGNPGILRAGLDAQKNIQQLQTAQLAAINGFSARNAVA